MLQRSVLQLSSRRALRRIPRQISTQIPALLSSSRKEFSSVPPQGNASSKPGSTGKPPESGSSLPKVIIGSVAVGAVFFAAYQNGYLDQILGKQLKEDKVGFEYRDVKDIQKPAGQLDSRGSEELNKFDNKHPGEQLGSLESQESSKLSPDADQKSEGLSDIPHFASETQGVDQSQVQDKPGITPVEVISPVQEKEVSEHAQLRAESSDQSTESGISSKESPDIKSTEEDTRKTPNEIHTTPVSTQDGAVLQESDTQTLPHPHISTENRPEDTLGNVSEPLGSLLEEYHLKDETEDIIATLISQGPNGYNHFPNEKEDLISSIGELNDGYITKDGKLVLDFLQAIHAAEKRQAELDARVFAEEKRALKEKYEKELKDAAARELMQAEEVAMLDKDLKRERAKAVLALNALQEKLEEKLKMELKQKEIEEELKLKKLQELAKAELAAAITSEKAAQIEKMAEANLHINALCMAFYARSEEARQSHFAHKLALGAVALEDALSKGLPIQTEIDALHSYLDGGDKDPILDLVLSSLPEETRKNGTDTLLQLNHKFDALKVTLRHFSLIPPGGGGILAHSLAHIASWLKVKEVDRSGDGIESVINRVEGYLAEGKLAEAAAVLEEGVRGTQSAEIVGDWLRQVRNRAITEQALTLLQSYATAISLK
ncbi:MICOS complex subunit MIC60, mitochondrial [Castanea sativa]|uniref:MICOS complex subunit MIC60, mitochondrial n=1 Tax=Castanea sativa TaxID=21020 RepID=UPI003F64C09C